MSTRTTENFISKAKTITMARKVSISAAQAFNLKKPGSYGNTKVTLDKQGNASLILFGNRIAIRTSDERLFITTCGWNTVTTLSRLNEIGSFRVRHQRGTLIINNTTWDGRWVEVVEMDPFVTIFKNDPPL